MNLNFLKIKVPLWTLILSTGLLLSSFIWQLSHPQKKQMVSPGQPHCSLDILRIKDYQFTKPLVMVDFNGEEERFSPLKSQLQEYTRQRQSSGKLTDISVYFRDLSTGRWFSINPGEKYTMGSIMKIMTLITYLKVAESNPAILKKQIKLDRHFNEIPDQKIIKGLIQPGKSYSVEELLKYMIIESDNDATALLNNNINFEIYKVALKAMQLSIPDPSQWNYELNVIECSRLLRILYNSSFIKPEYSELALEWMSKSSYMRGLARNIDPSIPMSRKFGERGSGQYQQLHETAIVYTNDQPYLITVLCKGNDQEFLEDTMAEISTNVFQWISSNAYLILN